MDLLVAGVSPEESDQDPGRQTEQLAAAGRDHEVVECQAASM